MPLLRSKYGEEKVVDGGLENWTNNTPDDWTERYEEAGVRDITDEGTIIHKGSHAVKIEVTNDPGALYLVDITQNLALLPNSYYILSGWYHFPTRTEGKAQLLLENDGEFMYAVNTLSTTASYTYVETVCKTTVSSSIIYARLRYETTTGIVYFDDISVRLIYPQRRGS